MALKRKAGAENRTGFFSNQVESLERLFQDRSRLEAHGLAGFDLDFFAGLGIASYACLPGTNAERSETGVRETLILAHGLRDVVED